MTSSSPLIGRQKSGKAGGEQTLKRKGRAFYAEIGRKGGKAGVKKEIDRTSPEYLLSLMDPAWYIPQWNIVSGKLWTEEQITAKKRVQAYLRKGWGQTALARLCDVSPMSVHEWSRNVINFPSWENANKVHAALDAYELSILTP